MIKANELMIGNLLLNAGGVVVSTTTQTISDVELKLIVRNPIPLTEEWLLKLPKGLVYPEWIKFVHELQNWFYIENKCEKELVFGEELQLNTTPCNNAQP